jgi:nucleotide-binding universal stress UspA family protein
MEIQPRHGFEHIIAATDLSDCAANALDYAKSIALRFNSRLTVVHAGVFPPRYGSMHTNSAVAISEAWAAQHEAARIALDERHALQLQNVPNSDRLVVSGRPAESILACASTLGAGLITVGTFGRTGIRRAVLGSVAETLIRDSVAPVLTVPCNNLLEPKFERVLLAVHGARLAREVFEHAAVIASSFDAELVVLGLGAVADALEDFEIQRLREWMGDVRVPIRTKIVMHRGDAAEQILWQARQESADVLVVGLRQAANPTILAASVKTLVRHSSCPVITVPVSRSQISRI